MCRDMLAISSRESVASRANFASFFLLVGWFGALHPQPQSLAKAGSAASLGLAASSDSEVTKLSLFDRVKATNQDQLRPVCVSRFAEFVVGCVFFARITVPISVRYGNALLICPEIDEASWRRKNSITMDWNVAGNLFNGA